MQIVDSGCELMQWGLIWKLLRGRGVMEMKICVINMPICIHSLVRGVFERPSKCLQTQRTEILTQNILLFFQNVITIDPIFH
jgi:hypothetical protein